MLEPAERRYLDAARVGRLGTADADGRPHVVPVCYARRGDVLVSALDEKPKRVDPADLRRVRNLRANPRVALVVDHYTENWEGLGWVQVRGTADLLDPGDEAHQPGVAVLEEKYEQYATHELGARPLIQIEPASVTSWGKVDPVASAGSGAVCSRDTLKRRDDE